MTHRLDPSAFMQEGYLQELNRRFLHPLGLALAVSIDDDGTVQLDSILDFRFDPEGCVFGPGVIDPGKADRIEGLERDRKQAREAALGYWVQPTGDM